MKSQKNRRLLSDYHKIVDETPQLVEEAGEEYQKLEKEYGRKAVTLRPVVSSVDDKSIEEDSLPANVKRIKAATEEVLGKYYAFFRKEGTPLLLSRYSGGITTNISTGEGDAGEFKPDHTIIPKKGRINIFASSFKHMRGAKLTRAIARTIGHELRHAMERPWKVFPRRSREYRQNEIQAESFGRWLQKKVIP